ncbi:hypothetical protein Tco_0322707 [Tanacetum coccineum]
MLSHWKRYNLILNIMCFPMRQHSEQPESINDTYVMEKVNSNIIPDSSGMCDNDNRADQNAEEYDDERAVLANLIANLKLDNDENKKIQNQLKKGTHHSLMNYKSALHDKDVELAKYKTYKDRTIENDTLERKLKETLGLLAQKKNDTKKVLKLKGYEISVVKEKKDLVKEKNKIPYDKDDLANIFAPDREETLTLEQEGVTHGTSVSRLQLRSTQMKEKVVQNNSQVKSKKTKVKDYVSLSWSKLSNVDQDSGANDRPPMLERGNYIPWESRFKRFLDNKLEDGERIVNLMPKMDHMKGRDPNPDNT